MAIITLKDFARIPTRIGVTGSPGTGKKTVGRELAKITGFELLLFKDFAMRNGLGAWKGNEYLVDVGKASNKVDTRRKIVCGHLLPYVITDSKIDVVVVLRCAPKVLLERYRKRKYTSSKILENIEAEMIGVVSERASRVYTRKKLMEFDTTRSRNPKTLAKRILQTIQGRIPSSFGRIDWLSSRYSAQTMIESLSAGRVITKP